MALYKANCCLQVLHRSDKLYHTEGWRQGKAKRVTIVLAAANGGRASQLETMKTILLIDDDAVFLNLLEQYVEKHYPDLQVLTCNDPIKCLALITTGLDLLLVDLEMPGLDGAKVLSYAIAKGLNKNRIIILSGRDADYLHKRFPMGSCLAVLNKFETKQRDVLDMIFNALQNKEPQNDACNPLPGKRTGQ